MRVRVTDGTQVSHDGTTYVGGEVFECSKEDAEKFIAEGWVAAVKATTRKSKTKK